MSIQMIGIDHTKAPVDIRAVFAFTKKNIAKVMEAWREIPGLHGCVIISTCNRMEIWASLDEELAPDLFELLCREKQADPQKYKEYVIFRRGREAVKHLFELSSGLQSRILGEDQIITQVKDALALARENYGTDNVLEVLFRMAVTAAKKVKTEVALSKGNGSAIQMAVELLKEKGYSFEGRNCMVIGNGEMGRLSATVLKEAGADVTVTVRQYRSGVVEIPKGCKRIDYGERMELFPSCDYVVSATASPNYTLTEAAVRGVCPRKPVVIIDLAVPRDVEPSVGKLGEIELYDIDDFKAGHHSEQTMENVKHAEEILECKMEEFFDWYEGRDVIEQISKVKELAVEDFHLRTRKQIRELKKDGQELGESYEEELEEFQHYMESAAEKVLNKMIFGIKGNVSDRTFRECMEAMEKVFQQ